MANRIEQNIANFISVFRQGARPNRYRVDISVPGPLQGQFASVLGGNTENFYFFCKAASLPENTIGVVEVPFMGRKFKVHGDRVFNEWSITIFNEEGNLTRRFFELWMHRINTHESNIRTLSTLETPNYDTTSYYATGKVKQLRVDGEDLDEATGTYYFYYMFPSSLGAIDLAYDTNDTIEEFTVTMQYSWWSTSDNSESNAVTIGATSEDDFGI